MEPAPRRDGSLRRRLGAFHVHPHRPVGPSRLLCERGSTDARVCGASCTRDHQRRHWPDSSREDGPMEVRQRGRRSSLGWPNRDCGIRCDVVGPPGRCVECWPVEHLGAPRREQRGRRTVGIVKRPCAVWTDRGPRRNVDRNVSPAWLGDGDRNRWCGSPCRVGTAWPGRRWPGVPCGNATRPSHDRGARSTLRHRSRLDEPIRLSLVRLPVCIGQRDCCHRSCRDRLDHRCSSIRRRGSGASPSIRYELDRRRRRSRPVGRDSPRRKRSQPDRS